MDLDFVSLLKDHIDAKVDPIREDVRELKDDVRDLKQFKWRVTGIVIAAGSMTGLTGFSIAKLLDRLLN